MIPTDVRQKIFTKIKCQKLWKAEFKCIWLILAKVYIYLSICLCVCVCVCVCVCSSMYKY